VLGFIGRPIDLDAPEKYGRQYVAWNDGNPNPISIEIFEAFPICHPAQLHGAVTVQIIALLLATSFELAMFTLLKHFIRYSTVCYVVRMRLFGLVDV